MDETLRPGGVVDLSRYDHTHPLTAVRVGTGGRTCRRPGDPHHEQRTGIGSRRAVRAVLRFHLTPDSRQMRNGVESLVFLLAVAAFGWLIVQFDKGQKESWRRAIANVVTPLAAYGCLTLMPFVAIEIHREVGSGLAAIVGTALAGCVLLWGNMRLFLWLEKWADAKRPPDDKKK